MHRIDDLTYIDTHLITCAEYQLFIDEMRQQGKYFQPDHWTSYQFPEDQAEAPIFGVRPSDAITFCDWITRREAGEWNYRIPTEKEAEAYPIQPLSTITPSAYWVFSLPDLPRIFWITRAAEVEFALDLDRNLDLDLDREFNLDHNRAQDCEIARARACDRARNLAGALNFIRNRAHAHNFDLTRNLERACAQTQELASALARDHGSRSRDRNHALASALARARDHAIELDRAPVHPPDLARKLVHDLDLACDLARDLAGDLDLLRNLARVHDLTRDSTLAQDLTLSLALDLHRILALDRAGPHVLAHDCACTLALDLAHIRAHARDLARDRTRILDLAHARALALDLKRSFNLAHDIHLAHEREMGYAYGRNLGPVYARDLSPTHERAIDLARDLAHARDQRVSTNVSTLYNIALNLLLLQLRLEGTYPAFEGIRIVKERKAE